LKTVIIKGAKQENIETFEVVMPLQAKK